MSRFYLWRVKTITFEYLASLMLRIIFVLAALAVIALIVRKLLASAEPQPRPDKSKPKPLTDMVRCETCGVHLPVNEAIKQGEHHFCSLEHKEQYSDKD